MKITAWKMNKAVTLEINGYPTDPRVLMVGLLAQPEKRLVRPAGVCLPTHCLKETINQPNLQVIQLAVSIMEVHRDTNERTPKTRHDD